MHVSIKTESRDDLAPWPWSGGAPAGVAVPSEPVAAGGAPPYPGTVLKQQSRGPGVHALQQRLKDLGFSVDVDGNFGPGTFGAVSAFQRQKGLGADGKVGPNTWAALFAN
jgi:peptidoglycan hydrolase-like protein with peptidoglycan-binding domain